MARRGDNAVAACQRLGKLLETLHAHELSTNRPGFGRLSGEAEIEPPAHPRLLQRDLLHLPPLRFRSGLRQHRTGHTPSWMRSSRLVTSCWVERGLCCIASKSRMTGLQQLVGLHRQRLTAHHDALRVRCRLHSIRAIGMSAGFSGGTRSAALVFCGDAATATEASHRTMTAVRVASVSTHESDEALIDRLHRGAFNYFLRYVNPLNGLVADTSRSGRAIAVSP